MNCEYPGCSHSLALTCCKLAYDTQAYYCAEHAQELGYCISCGYKFKLTKKGICKSCQQMQKEALEGGWID